MLFGAETCCHSPPKAQGTSHGYSQPPVGPRKAKRVTDFCFPTSRFSELTRYQARTGYTFTVYKNFRVLHREHHYNPQELARQAQSGV